MIDYITDREIYQKLVCTHIPRARRFLWIATADVKDLYVDHHGHMAPFLEVLSDLAGRSVELRLLHAKRPGRIFWRDYARYPCLDEGLEMMLCPRVHLKSVVIDGKIAYSGSANLTGAGMGAKNKDRRNFEAGILTDDPTLIQTITEQFDRIWRGDFCKDCQRKGYCAEHEDILSK